MKLPLFVALFLLLLVAALVLYYRPTLKYITLFGRTLRHSL